MPIDTSMYAGLRKIEPIDPYAGQEKRLQLKHLVQAGQMQDLQLRQAKQDELDQQTVRDVMAEHNGDIETALPSLAGKVGPKTFLGLQNAWVEQQKNKLGLAEQQGKVADQLHETLAKMAAGVQKAGNTPEAFTGAIETIGALNPAMKQHLLPYVQQAEKDPSTIGPMMDQFLSGSKFGQDQMKAQADVASAAARTKTADIGAQRLTLETPGIAAGNTIKAQEAAGTKPIQPAEQLQIAGQAAGRAETARHNTVEEGQGAARIGVERGRLGIEQKRFNATLGSGLDASGQPLPPDALKQRASGNPAAVAIAEYRMRPPQVRNGIVPPVMRDVLAINPTYDATQFDARNAYRKALTSGAQGQALNSLNTAIEHLDQFSEMAKSLGNGAFQPGNRLTNWIKATFGDSAPTNFDGMKTIMAGELASAFKKSGATDQEIHSVTSAIDRANSPNQLVDYATKVAIPALGGKIRTYEDQTKAQMGEKDPLVNQIVTPSARQVLGKYGSNVSGGGQGAVQYKQTATGKNGHKIGSNDGRTWFDLQTGKQLQ